MSDLKIGDKIKTCDGNCGRVIGFYDEITQVLVTHESVSYLYDDEFTIVEQQQLNDNQQIVFEWLKEQRVQKNGLILPPFEIISNLLTYVQQNGDDIFRCFALMSEKEQAEVLAAFTQWALEQEEAE